MDAQRLADVESDLLAWGLLEERDGLRSSRRYQAALARAAAELASLEAREGPHPGHPVEEVVARALRDLDVPAAAQLSRDHERFLVALQLASLPPAVRRSIGL